MSHQQTHTNRLIQQTSPYLRQHAHNPVDWYPWSEEALNRARELDRPIFLSVGYSACHWCHVMAHESFADPKIGALLDEHFVSIKVDREERPDLDRIYMAAVQLLTQQGGWPMSVFLTPRQKPFFGGTYFPPEERFGRPSFANLLQALAHAWQEKRPAIEQQADLVTDHVRQLLLPPSQSGPLGPELLQNAVEQLGLSFDPGCGGFGSAPKFPHPIDLRLLLRAWKRFGDDQALAMVRTTLDHMARGGLYDHLGGGFHRYSTDAAWLVPHFEKMLYDNALLAQAYLEGYQATHDDFYRDVVEITVAYLLREMASPAGPFFSAQDADSEGQEGKFFVWSLAEIKEVLGVEADLLAAVYDVTDAGNWDGSNILHLSRSYRQNARALAMPQAELGRRLAGCREKLLAVRQRRTWPGRDEKVLAGWNGLAIAALAEAGLVLGQSDWIAAASKAADFILTHLRTAQGRLLRTCTFNSPTSVTLANVQGFQEDYAFMINGLVSLHQATSNSCWLDSALDLAKVMQEQFFDSQQGGFFYTGKDHEQLLACTKDLQDNSLPSGNGMAVLALLRLARLTKRPDLAQMAQLTLAMNHNLLAQAPLAAGQMLLGLDLLLDM